MAKPRVTRKLSRQKPSRKSRVTVANFAEAARDAVAEITADESTGDDAGAGGEEVTNAEVSGELNADLQALVDEAASSPLAGDEPVADAPTASRIDPGNMVMLLAPAVGAVGNFACDMFRVTHLENDEIGNLSGAFVGVIDAYGALDKLDPKTAAWLALAGVTMGVAMRRRPLPPKPEPEVAAASATE